MTLYERLMTSAQIELDKKWDRLMREGKFDEAAAVLKTKKEILSWGKDYESA